jgi:hypothetical protein
MSRRRQTESGERAKAIARRIYEAAAAAEGALPGQTIDMRVPLSEWQALTVFDGIALYALAGELRVTLRVEPDERPPRLVPDRPDQRGAP